MRRMSRKEAVEFFSQGTRTGKFATAKYLARNPWASYVVDLEEPPPSPT